MLNHSVIHNVRCAREKAILSGDYNSRKRTIEIGAKELL